MYDRLRATGYTADPFARYRIDLLLAHPFAGWKLRDLAGLLALAAAFAAFALLPLVVTAPVHYRGLARRLRGTLPVPGVLPWELNHAWYALAVVLVSELIGLYLLAYPDFEDSFGMAPFGSALSDDRTLGHAYLLGFLVTIVFVSPLVRGARGVPLVEGRWPIRRSLSAATVTFILYRRPSRSSRRRTPSTREAGPGPRAWTGSSGLTAPTAPSA
jgi:hypothetical protein